MTDQRKLANILETYFSDAHLLWDKLLQKHLKESPEELVLLETLVKLPRFKALGVTPDALYDAATACSLSKLKFDTTGTRLGRIKPFVANKKQVLDPWAIYVASEEGLEKPYTTEHTIANLFTDLVGHVSFVHFPKDQYGKEGFYGFCFVEFDDESNVEKAVECMNRYEHTPSAEWQDKYPETVAKGDKLYLRDRWLYRTTWNALREEYITVQERLRVSKRQQWEDYEASAATKTKTQRTHQEYAVGKGMDLSLAEKTPAYEKGIIALVSRIHPKCSKTVIHTFLQQSNVSIPFVNRRKGLDYASISYSMVVFILPLQCHVRLTSPKDAQTLVDYFQQHLTLQETNTDAIGKTAGADDGFQTVTVKTH
ncbi:hypothetical protein BDF14DRAFT_1882689 [Spinellus fusiger]|nr:hypothetical protein BDF14DRAFT_1882689 [Spinellus fusiger]